ncbi:unnamed protein product [Bursaphelenchus okinawaensis]|uniref:Uncharacterized protein n=1 Tax=Bursaphelenchus okinawaensis TaxID=465554 RepID=A0A811LJE1_9BILA|nr:unnamed protein product [Bursaphelenchus okinawaensis]CAG9124740.1 unnamed protein product [Bursaphelenchus okinawaensis]
MVEKQKKRPKLLIRARERDDICHRIYFAILECLGYEVNDETVFTIKYTPDGGVDVKENEGKFRSLDAMLIYYHTFAILDAMLIYYHTFAMFKENGRVESFPIPSH